MSETEFPDQPGSGERDLSQSGLRDLDAPDSSDAARPGTDANLAGQPSTTNERSSLHQSIESGTSRTSEKPDLFRRLWRRWVEALPEPHAHWVAILLLALILRMVPIGAASYHPDERHVLRYALNMLENGTLEPTKMNYGSLPIYLQAALLGLIELLGRLIGLTPPLREGIALGPARWLSAVASLLTVYMTGTLARALLRRQSEEPQRQGNVSSRILLPTDKLEPGLRPGDPPPFADRAAALLMAVAFLAVQCAQYATVDSLLTLLTTASVCASLAASDSRRTRNFVLAGVLAGLATATKYTGCLSAIALACIPLLPDTRPRPWRQTLVGLACVPLAFVAGMPYALLRFDRLLEAVVFESEHYRSGGETIFAVGYHTWWWNLKFLYFTGLGPANLLMALFGMGMLLLMKRSSTDGLPSRARAWMTLAYPLLAYVFVSRFVVRFDRNILPLLPFLCVSGGVWLEQVSAIIGRYRRAWQKPLVVGVLGLSVLYPLMRDVVFDTVVYFPHPKYQYKRWKQSLPPGTRLKEHGRTMPTPLARLQKERFDYVVLSSHSYEPVAAEPERFDKLARIYREIFERCQVAQIFRSPWFENDFFAPHSLLNSATVNVYHGPTLLVFSVASCIDAPSSVAPADSAEPPGRSAREDEAADED